MNFEEWVAKPLLRKFGIPTLHGKIAQISFKNVKYNTIKTDHLNA